MILPRSSAERKSCFFVSNRSKHTWNQELSEKRDRVSDMRVMRVFEKAQTVVSNCREVFQLSCLHVSQKERPGERVYKLSPSDIWSHRRRGRSPRWSPRSQFPRRGPASWSWTRWRRRWRSTRRWVTRQGLRLTLKLSPTGGLDLVTWPDHHPPTAFVIIQQSSWERSRSYPPGNVLPVFYLIIA